MYWKFTAEHCVHQYKDLKLSRIAKNSKLNYKLKHFPKTVTDF